MCEGRLASEKLSGGVGEKEREATLMAVRSKYPSALANAECGLHPAVFLEGLRKDIISYRSSTEECNTCTRAFMGVEERDLDCLI